MTMKYDWNGTKEYTGRCVMSEIVWGSAAWSDDGEHCYLVGQEGWNSQEIGTSWSSFLTAKVGYWQLFAYVWLYFKIVLLKTHPMPPLLNLVNCRPCSQIIAFNYIIGLYFRH